MIAEHEVCAQPETGEADRQRCVTHPFVATFGLAVVNGGCRTDVALAFLFDVAENRIAGNLKAHKSCDARKSNPTDDVAQRSSIRARPARDALFPL